MFLTRQKQDSNEIFLFQLMYYAMLKILNVTFYYHQSHSDPYILFSYNSSCHLSSSGFRIACMFDGMGLDILNV